MERSTKQKVLIEEVLEHDSSHPTMAELCQKIQMKDPSIGQATVYRNVNRLVSSGKIKRVSTKEGVDHYDGERRNHYHLVCKQCGKIVDLFDYKIPVYLKELEQTYQVCIKDYQMTFDGVCHDCLRHLK